MAKTKKSTITSSRSSKKDASKALRTMEELLSQSGYNLKIAKKGEIVEGLVTSITRQEVLVDIGTKTEGVVTGKELYFVSDFVSKLAVGDTVFAYVISTENDSGQLTLSLRRAAGEKRWQKLEKALEEKKIVEVKGVETNRGGLIVDVDGIRGFVPSSQLDISHLGKADKLIGEALKVKVIEVNRKTNRLILSEKEAADEETRGKREKLLKTIQSGDELNGIVSGVMHFGVFVNMDGVEGLVHISEIAWEKVDDPGRHYRAGDKVKVKVLEIDYEGGKLNLSIKRLTPDPWQEIAKGYEESQEIKGTVTRMTDFGAFVRLGPGIDGLVHISKIPPEEKVDVGDQVTCVIESIDTENRRIALALLPTKTPTLYK